MSFMLLIIEPTGQRATRSEAEGREAYAQMQRFGEELRSRGQLLASQSLRSLASAARVRRRDDRTQVVDGPFAEAKEMIGGFFLLDGVSRDEAIEIAGRCPAARWCEIEVRELGPCFDDSHAPPRGPSAAV